MPYDPRMLQMAQMGVGMMGPQQSSPANQPPGTRPRQWWEQPMPAGRNQQDDQSANSPKQPPSLLDMMIQYGGGMPSSGMAGASGGLLKNPWLLT
jgi:hypothetical protein